MSAAHALGWRGAAVLPRRLPVSAAGAGGPAGAPLVAILCDEPRARVAAAGVALALARISGRRLALAGGVGAPAGAAAPAMPSAQRAAAALQRRGLATRASGRLVWLADRRGALQADDVPSRCAAVGAELGRAAAALGVPAAVAYPFGRTDALDRVLAWHDAVVVVREPDTPAALIERALASLVRLGRPAVAMAPPARVSGALATVGYAVPLEAAAAVADLLSADRGRAG